MSDNKPVLLCISNEVDLQTGKTREVSRLYGNASGMVCDVQTAERNADRLAAMRETDGAKPFDLTADQFAAVSAYYAACRQPTPNAEGVRVGDIFYNVWGYDQTNVDFYQVVSLYGAHTAVIRPLHGRVVEEGNMCGKVVPDRNNFKDDETFSVRTKPNKWNTANGPQIKDPRFRDHTMSRTDDFKPHDFSTWA